MYSETLQGLAREAHNNTLCTAAVAGATSSQGQLATCKFGVPRSVYRTQTTIHVANTLR